MSNISNTFTDDYSFLFTLSETSVIPRAPGPINNEFAHFAIEGKSPMVQCRHCKEGKVAKASNKRKAAHLRPCEAYLRAQGAAANDSSLEPIHDVNAIPRQSIVVAKPYWWPHDASLRPETTALVVIDMQRDCRSNSNLHQSVISIIPFSSVAIKTDSLL